MKQYNRILANGFLQNNQQYYSAVLPHKLIEQYSEVLVYGKNAGGYQRDPDPNHYNKIRDYIKNNDNFILPTSIVLAIDEDVLSKVIVYHNENTFLDFSEIMDSKLFRIVDGQHRIIAMREAIKHKPKLKDFLFNVIILVTKDFKRSIEMEVFYDINSKSKRLKVDLIELARFNYRILEKNFNLNEINEHISIQTAYYLNEKIDNCVWNNAIKFGIHDDHVIGIIGVNAFRESISKIVDAYLNINENGSYLGLEGELLVNYSMESAFEIAEFIHRAWDIIIKSKWEYCFKDGITELDLFFEPQKIYYNQKFYIQRTMGAKVLNYMLGDIVNGINKDKSLGLGVEALNLYEKTIRESNVSSEDWQVGGSFSGYSSESGFKKVSEIIKNKLPINKFYL